jgi:hypothetical protein
MSAFVETLLQYIRQSAPLVVVTLTVTIAGLGLFAVQQWQLFDFRGLPEWVLPSAFIIWALCAVHVAISTAMALWREATTAARYIAKFPERRRRAAYERPIIERLRATDGIEREVLCYALYQDNDTFWVSPWTRQRSRWLHGLLAKGLLKQSDTGITEIFSFVSTPSHGHTCGG